VKFNDFDRAAVADVIADLPPEFRTGDVTSHPTMLGAHPETALDFNYRSMTGRYLSNNGGSLRIRLVRRDRAEPGAHWKKM
jgi:hypothetical protein